MAVARSPHRATRFVLAAMVPMAVFAAWSAMDGASFPTTTTTPYAVPTTDGGARAASGSDSTVNVARAAARAVPASSPSPRHPHPPPSAPASPPGPPADRDVRDGDDDDDASGAASSGEEEHRAGSGRPPAHVAAGCAAGDWPANYQKLTRELPEAHAALDASPRERRYFDRALASCGCDVAVSQCPDFARRYLEYARYHRRVTDGDPTVSPGARILVVQNAWRTYGFGHMAPAAAGWILWGMASGFVIYFDNESSEWNWLDYFRAYLPPGDHSTVDGLDVRWTKARAEAMEARRRTWFMDQDEAVFDLEEFNWDEVIACRGTGGNCTEVGACQRGGMEGGEECAAARAHGSCAVGTRDAWECEGCNVCLMDALRNRRRVRIVANSLRVPIFDETRREMREFSRSFWTEPAAWSSEMYAYKQGPDVVREFLENRERSHWCRTCAMALALRPDASLGFWRDLARSDTAFARRMYVLKARSGYPEAASCFPDDTRATDACVDETWAHPPCAEFTAQWHIKNKAPDQSSKSGYLTPTNAVRGLIDAMNDDDENDGLDGFDESWFDRVSDKVSDEPPRAVVHVLTDAPALQDFLASRFPDFVRVTPGRGTDPTNNIRRDQDFGAESSRKIAIDMYVQAWADGETELGPSAYYAAGAELAAVARYPRGYRRVGDVPAAPTRWDSEWYGANATARAAARVAACAGGEAIAVRSTAGSARLRRERGGEEAADGDDGDESEETVTTVTTVDEEKARRLGARCAGASASFEPVATVRDRPPLAVVDELARAGVLAADKSVIEMNTLHGDLAACAASVAGRVEVSLPKDNRPGMPSRRACRGMRRRGLRVTCGTLLTMNPFEIPNVDVYMARAGGDADSCAKKTGWHKLLERLRVKLTRRLGGADVPEEPADEDFVRALRGKTAAIVAADGTEAEAARRTVRDAGWTGWNETEVAWTEGDADGTATVFLLPMDSPGVRSVAC